ASGALPAVRYWLIAVTRVIVIPTLGRLRQLRPGLPAGEARTCGGKIVPGELVNGWGTVLDYKEADLMAPEAHKLLSTTEEFPDHLTHEVSRELIRLARSRRSADVDTLVEIAMTRGLRHPRIAIDAVAADQSAKIARRLLWVSGLAAVA